MKRSTHPDAFFTAGERADIQKAIEEAEKTTSAEIKLIVLRHCWIDIKRKAAALFKKHGLDKTKQRNAVLILLVTANREFLIYGDKGIHEKVGQSFWDDVRNGMLAHFQNDEMGAGLQAGITLIGEKLKQYFPCTKEDINEIDNGVVHED